GTYTYTVGSPSGYSSTADPRPVVVSGYNQTLPVTFSKKPPPVTPPTLFLVAFNATDLRPGLDWSVRWNGTNTVTAQGTVISFSAPNGTYPYEVEAPTGFSASPHSGNATVAGAATLVEIFFASIPSPPAAHSSSAAGLPWIDFAVVGIFAAVALLTAGVWLSRRGRRG
ncbi:MAG TPA: hypothetical protein VN842_04615, partial [Thermoplasmata archaeon]|nr:hypothetical protein [Thermoplasmata archaeon]